MNSNGLSIIIPTYNEEKTIRDLIERILLAFKESGTPIEIIVIDDRSTDDTRRVLGALRRKYPILVRLKEGKSGKGYSILEGSRYATKQYIAMIDADLQYPPEILPDLYRIAKEKGIAVARRKTYRGSLIRTIASRANAILFGSVLLNLPTDIQSGLKIFHRDAFDYLDPSLISAWAIDIPLLHTAYELGHSAGHVDIDFHPRSHGSSNVRLFKTAFEIASGAIRTKLSSRTRHSFQPVKSTMAGTSVWYQRKRFVTHTTLPHALSALVSLTIWQKLAITFLVSFFIVGFIYHAYATAILFTATISFIYFSDALFNIFVIMRSLHFPPDIKVNMQDLRALSDSDLPIYSILCPLYREAAVLPQFVQAMSTLDWPKKKLDVILLLEENDEETIAIAHSLNLPSYIRIIVVPDGQPKTKPKACNFGLSVARGEYVVIFDAEDKPDTLQLKKAYLAFKRAEPNIACMQAKLNYYNPHDNLLTRLFTAEYSLWFDVVLPGLQSIQTTIPLGGTSNHFRMEKLLELKGWDPFNVTEDADLGARLFRQGYKTAIIDSVTLEEANSNFRNWFRQRSRWIKGYIQTYFVHFRNPFQFARQYGRHALLFQLIIGGKIAFMLINPILWAVTISYFVLYSVVGPTIEAVYPGPVFYMAAFSLVFGNFIYLYNYMIGVAKRGQWDLVKFVFLVPVYWLMISMSATTAVVQFIVKPFYWEKTIHGLHLSRAQQKKGRSVIESVRSRATRVQVIVDLINAKFLSNLALIGSNFIANIVNFVFSAYLARIISIEDFGLIGLIGSFWYVAQVPLGALSGSVAHKSAYLLGAYATPASTFWKSVRRSTLKISLVITLCWIAISPILAHFFKESSVLPFLIFAPAWAIGTITAVDRGFLNGNLVFFAIALMTVVEPIAKLLTSLLLVRLGGHSYVYVAIPISMVAGLAVLSLFAQRLSHRHENRDIHSHVSFPWNYYVTSLLTNVTGIMYLSIDVVLAKHYLSPSDAGLYAILSLAGKMIYFLGSLTSSFLVPYVSRELGAKRSTERVFKKLLGIGLLTNIAAYLLFGAFSFLTVPILWGPKSLPIVNLMPLYGMGMVTYSVATLIIAYHQIHSRYAFPVIGFLLAVLQIVGTIVFHGSIGTIAAIVSISGVLTFAAVLILHKYYTEASIVYQNLLDFLGLFLSFPKHPHVYQGTLRILIFNWRDTKHLWSGGAEVYIHELSKRWVREGHHVTIFCGNDGRSPRYEWADGVRIIRRGGFYTVYLWAMLYYLKHFKGNFDRVIDSENGIPFFTPLYVKEKTFLLIHHVHQEVFRRSLLPPFSWIAQLLEKRLMPLVYRNVDVITVSPSSKEDILHHHLTTKEPHIVYNGVDLARFKPGKKDSSPLVLYLGRLTSAKSLPVFLRSAALILEGLPKAKFIIAGDGPERTNLIKLADKFGISDAVTFLGKVSHEEKVSLMQRAWVFVNPSLIEGWGITTIEANACGTPVVASNVPGLRDAVRNPHSGYLVQYGNLTAFTTAILKILSNSRLRIRMSKWAVEWAKNYDWETSAKQSLDMLRI